MQVTQEQTDNLSVLVTFTIEPSDYQPRLDKALKDMRRKASLKGFRKGMVPLGYLKKMAGKDLLNKELEAIIDTELKKFLSDARHNMLAQPMVKEHNVDIDLNEDKDYSVVMEIGIAPEFEIPLLMGDKSTDIVKYIVNPTEEFIEKQVLELRKRHGEQVSVTDIEENDNIKIELFELDTETALPKADGVNNITWIRVDMFKEGDAKTNFLMMEKGDDMDIDLFEVFNKEKAQVAHILLNVKEADKVEALSPKFRLIIQDVRRMETAEMNEAFLEKILGTDEKRYEKTEAGLHKAISEDAAAQYQSIVYQQVSSKLQDALLEQTPMELPDDFLKRYIKANWGSPVEDSVIETEYVKQASCLKWALIINKINEQAAIKVEEEDVRGVVQEDIIKNWWRYSKEQPTGESFKKVLESKLKETTYVNNIGETIFEQKIFAYLLNEFNFDEQEVSIAEFNEIMKAETEKMKEAEAAEQVEIAE